MFYHKGVKKFTPLTVDYRPGGDPLVVDGRVAALGRKVLQQIV